MTSAMRNPLALAIALCSGFAFAAPAATDDWPARSTASGVTLAVRDFSKAGHAYADKLDPTLLARVAFIPGGGLELRWPKGATGGSPAWMASLDPAWTSQAQGIGATPYWIEFDYEVPASRLARGVDGGGGFKLCIVGGYIPNNWTSSPSDINNEFVVGNVYYRGFPVVVLHTMSATSGNWDGNYESFQMPFKSQYSNVDFKLQNALDRGRGLDDAHRYALYSQSPHNNSPPNPRNPGAFNFVAGERLRVKMRIHYATMGVGSGPGNEADLWLKRPTDAKYTHVVSGRGFPVPFDPEYPKGPNGIWLTSYDTGAGAYTADTYARYYDLIVSTRDLDPK